jgi:hypothetical protein
MTRLSSGTAWYRFGLPAVYVIWYGRRLSEVWLDGDVLEVKGPGGSFRVPLADVLLLDTGRSGRGSRVFVLGLDHPVGQIREVRFFPAKTTESNLQARIHAARAARKD